MAANRRASDAAVVGARQAGVAASGAARRGVTLAVPYVRHANESALGAAKTAVDVAGPYLAAGIGRPGEVLT